MASATEGYRVIWDTWANDKDGYNLADTYTHPMGVTY